MPDPNFTVITTSDGPVSENINSFASSLESEFAQTTGTGSRGGNRGNGQATSTASGAGAASVAASATSSPQTTFSTAIASSGNGASSSMNSGIASATASSGASNTSSEPVTVSEKSCNSISCSPALKAAVAVPIVVAAIAAIFLFFFCVKRRRKNGAVVSEKKPKKVGKKWSRHLRAFSFDAELLMGGRFSSTNSIRSRDPSVRSAANSSRNSRHSAEPSVHSIEEVAPPYRDAISSVQPPSPTQPRSTAATAAGAATGIAADPILRPSSTATAPPPYRSIVGETATEPPTPVSTRNPFADSAPVSPIEGSPFNDPPEDEEAQSRGVGLSRGSSMYRSVNAEDDASPTVSEAGSIMEAVVGRRVSLRAADKETSG